MTGSNFPKNVPVKGRVRICLDLIKEVGVRGKVVVDVGSSFGWLEKNLYRSGAKEIIGIEPNLEAVEFARRNTKGAEFFVGEAQNLPTASSYADVVLLYDVIEHVPKGTEEKVLSEVARVLKKRGKLLFSTPNSSPLSNFCDIAWYFGHRHYAKGAVIKMLKKAGFKIERIENRGSALSSIYLSWFYIAKRVLGKSQPRNKFFEKVDDTGYKKEGITDIFVVATKI